MEINNLRKGLKAKVNRLNEMQGMKSILVGQLAMCSMLIKRRHLIFWGINSIAYFLRVKLKD